MFQLLLNGKYVQWSSLVHIPALDCSRWSSCQAKFFPRMGWRFRVRSSSKGGGKLEKLAPGNLNYWLQTYWRNSFYDGVIQDHQFAMVNVLLHGIKCPPCPSKLQTVVWTSPPIGPKYKIFFCTFLVVQLLRHKGRAGKGGDVEGEKLAI